MTKGYFIDAFQNVRVMVLHDRIMITEKDGKRHIYRMGFDVEVQNKHGEPLKRKS